jgi:hypothetical protein
MNYSTVDSPGLALNAAPFGRRALHDDLRRDKR